MYQQVCTTAVWCGFTAVGVVTLMVYGRHVSKKEQMVFYLLSSTCHIPNC